MRKVFVFQICTTVDKVKLESAKSNGFSQMKRLAMLEERLKQKDFEHFGESFYSLGVAGLITCGRILMTAEESKDSANGDKACCKYGNSY
jgi:hypothetical protein